MLEALVGNGAHVAVVVGPNADDHVGVLGVSAARIHGVVLEAVVCNSRDGAALPFRCCDAGMVAHAFER